MWLKICAYILSVLVSLVITVPVNQRQHICAQTCNQTASLSYEIGSTYFYDYESVTDINIIDYDIGYQFTFTPIQINANVEISVHSLCELSLQLRSVQIKLNSSSTLSTDRLKVELEANSLNFGYDNGKIVGVCPSNEHELWALNVKKSILSALQISTNTLESETTVIETDISGECETIYKPKTNPDNTITVEKVKSRQKCIQNAKSLSGINLFNELFIRNLNFSESNINCAQVIENKIISSVMCNESQYFQSPVIMSPLMNATISLKFNHQINTVLGKRNQNFTSDDLSLTTKDSLIDFNEDKTNSFNTDDANRVQALYKLSVINFFLVPTKSELQYIIPLLQSSKISNQEILLISSLIAKYCKDQENCDQIDIIADTIEHLIERIQVSNPNDKLYLIKALENINITTHESAKLVLINLAESKSNEDDVRVASMYALVNCLNERMSETLMRLFRDNTESPEIRITAYKIIVTSGFADYGYLEEFSRETDPNVANYIRTHIKNLQKLRINNMLPENMPQFSDPDSNTFITSSNYDLTYSGVDINLDTIFPKPLSIPKTINIRTSLPLFGKQLQMIDITINQKGFDHYLKYLLSQTSDKIPFIYKELIDLFANKNLISDNINNYLQIMVKLDGKNMFIFDTRNFEVNRQQKESHIKQLIKNLMKTLSNSNDEIKINFLNHKIQIPCITGMTLNIDLNGSLKSLINEKNTRSIKTELMVDTYLANADFLKFGMQSKFESIISLNSNNIELSFKNVVKEITSLLIRNENYYDNLNALNKFKFEEEKHKFSAKFQLTNPNRDNSSVQLQIETPWKNLSIAASMDNQQVIRFDISDNGINEISFSFGVNNRHRGRYARSAYNEISNEIEQNANELSMNVNLKVYSFAANILVTFDQTNNIAEINVDYKTDEKSDKEYVKLFSSYKQYEQVYRLWKLEFISTQFNLNYRVINNMSINSYELMVDDLADTTRSFKISLYADLDREKLLPNYVFAKFSGALFENLPHYKRFSEVRVVFTPDQYNITARIITPFKVLRAIFAVSPDSEEVTSDECFGAINTFLFKLDNITTDMRNEQLLSAVARLSTDRLLFDIDANYKWKESVENLKLGYNTCMQISYPLISILANTSIESTQISNLNAKFLYFLSRSATNDIYNELLITWKKGFNDKIHWIRTLEKSMESDDDNVFLKENVTFIATPIDRHSEVIEIVKYDIILGNLRNFLVSIIKSDKTGRHMEEDYTISFELRFDYDLFSITGASVNATVQYWGRDMKYLEKWTKLGDDGREGKIYIQWQTERYANIEYTIDSKKLIDGRKADYRLKYQKWDQTESIKILGSLTRKASYDKDITRLNFQSDSGQNLKGLVTIDGGILSRLLNIYNVTYNFSYSTIEDVSVKVYGRRSFNFDKGSDQLEIDYKLPNTGNELIKYSSQVSRNKKLVNTNKPKLQYMEREVANVFDQYSDDVEHFQNNPYLRRNYQFDTEVTLSIATVFTATQWPQYNHNIDYNLVYINEKSVSHKLGLGWNDNNSLMLTHEKNKTKLINNGVRDNTRITIEAQPYDIEYEIKNTVSLRQPREGEVIYDRDLIATDLKMGNKNQLSTHAKLMNGVITGYYYVELNCPKTNASHKTNISMNYDYISDDLNQLTVDSFTFNERTNQTTSVKILAQEDNTVNIWLLFPDFDLTLLETNNNTTTKDTIVFVGKNQLIPYKHITELEMSAELDAFTAKSKTYEIVNNSGIADNNDMKLMVESNVEYEYRNRGLIEFVAIDQYKHRTELSYENWPSMMHLRSSMHSLSEDQPIYDISSDLSNDLILDLNVSLRHTQLEFELNPKQKTAKFVIND